MLADSGAPQATVCRRFEPGGAARSGPAQGAGECATIVAVRYLSASLLALVIAACSSTSEGPPPDAPAPPRRPLELASPFVGSGGFGFNFGSAFPGALAPQGLVKVGPDTFGTEWADINFLHYSGYWYGDDHVIGFSHLHLHGTGATDYGVLALMPLDGFDAGRIPRAGHMSPFKKESERASPGYYAVTLDNGGIQVELTATPRVAHHRYVFPASVAAPTVLVDLTHHLSGGEVTAVEARIAQGEASLRGKLRSIGGMSGGFGGYDVFFEARVSRPWASAQAWSGAAPAEGSEVSFSMPEGAEQKPAGFALSFAPSAEPLEVRVGVSLVSAEGAAANLEAEAPSFGFDNTRASAEAAWSKLLGAIEVEGGDEREARKLYSALYHLYLMPTRVGDADGSYVGMDGKVAKADGFSYCSDLSLWDTYRTLHPMYAILAPERDLDAVRSLHEMARAGGFFPKWPIATGESGTMIGASAEVVLADAYLKGITGFDAEGAYGIMREAAASKQQPSGGRGGRGDVVPYIDLGYVPAEIGGSVSKTVEYAVNDFAMAGLARALGKPQDADMFAARSKNYRALFDPQHGFLRAKTKDGAWNKPGYSPLQFGDEYVEANGWHTLWGPLHDVEGLIELFGGRDAFVAKLDEFYTKGRENYEEFPPDGTLKGSGMRPYFWASNEPVIHSAYLFAQAGRPDLTQKWVRWIQANIFKDTPDGLPGNDDGGTMSAWYLFNAMGFYPLAGSDVYFVGAPTFPRMVLHLPAGDFTIEAPGVSAENMYVQSVELNGAPLAGPTLRHADLKAGGSLRFSMGPQPGAWGR